MKLLRLALIGICLAFAPRIASADSPNTWIKLDKGEIVGRRSDVPLGYVPSLKRFLILGGRSGSAEYRKPRSYDVLSLKLEDGIWQNDFPFGKDWGPKSGPCMAPAWKGEVFGFRDLDSNIRPNWTVYGCYSLGQKYDYDPDTAAFYFYFCGKTFRYDPAKRTWTDLEPPTHPEKELSGSLLWSSMVYDPHSKQFVLFGGGNVQSPRGDPGTWTYSPARNDWTQLKLDLQPPQRANSRLAYDPHGKSILLFGGDQLDRLLSDTWMFDAVKQTWHEVKCDHAPAPRAGHALLWLPKAKKFLLVGGYTYRSTTDYVASLYERLPIELWTFDPATRRWDLLRRAEKKEGPDTPANFFLSAAVDDDDRVLVLGQSGTWTTQIEPAKIDAAGTAKHGVKPGAVETRTGSHDPAWYREGVPAADPAKVAAELGDIPANEWKLRPTPKRPMMNMDWGSAVFAPELDKILRFSGGHSAYSGTAPQVYDVKTDRYTIPFAPEYPVEFVYSNDQVRGEYSFKGNPWMSGHTYKSTGYDPRLKCLVFAPHDYPYFFDPEKGQWSRGPELNPYARNFYLTTVCATPEGAVVWGNKRVGGGPGLWRLDAGSRTWKPLPLQGDMPQASPDHHGMAYDSRRHRLLLFSDLGPHRGDVLDYDFTSRKTRWLEAAGKDKVLVPSRETIYLPEADGVLLGARVKAADGSMLWPLYDCASNTWTALALKGADPILNKGAFNNSMGLMYDPNRRLIWAVGQHSQVYVLRLDVQTARVPFAK